ncbi:MAG: ATP-binding protein [Moraxellaceae bacterium]|nr:ATP-binding protein [Pseudobdellovibrionaceae bacterium]
MSYKRDFNIPKTSFFLLGPRGSGKTTMLKNLNFASHTIDLLDSQNFRRLSANPHLLYEELSSLKANSFVIIDEIQKIPELLNEVHRLIENKKIKFALTGSSARKLKSVSANLLGGRAALKYMYPLTPHEMGADFNLNQALELGTLPLIIKSDDPEETLKSYVDLYLKEEIQAEALVRNLSGFIRFLPIAALMHGQKINLSSIARDSEVQRATVQGFFSILEDTLLVRRLEAYQAKIRVREQQKAKFYFIDPGIVRSCKNIKGEVAAEEKGSLFEGLIFTLLTIQKEMHQDIDSLHYWSPAEAKNTEVDFLISKGKGKIAVEVKSGTQVSTADLKGLKAITELKSVKRKIIVYNGNTSRTTAEGIEIMPFKTFINELAKKNI